MNVEVVQSSMFRGGLRKDFEDRTVEVIGMNKYFTPRRKEEYKRRKASQRLSATVATLRETKFNKELNAEVCGTRDRGKNPLRKDFEDPVNMVKL